MRVSVAIVARASASRMSLQFWLHKAAVQITGVDFLSCTGVQSKGFRCCKQVDKGRSGQYRCSCKITTQAKWDVSTDAPETV